MIKPKLFIGSSVEGLNIAYAVQENLAHNAEITVWPQGIFDLSKTAMSSLIQTIDRMDFAAFIFSPDDQAVIRGEEHQIARDNVLFELGLFIGKLSMERCFFLVPKEVEVKLPTDLLGINPAKYETQRTDSNYNAATGPACNEIRKRITNLGSIGDDEKEPQSYADFRQNLSTEKKDSSEIQDSMKIKNDKKENENDEVSALIKEEKYTEAVEALNEKIKTEQDEDKKLKLKYRKAEALIKIDFLSGVDFYKQLQEEYPNEDNVYILWAYQYYKRGLFEQATEHLTSGLKHVEDTNELTYYISLSNQDKKERILSLNNLLFEKPSFIKASILLALTYKDLNDGENQKLVLSEAHKLNPDNEEILFHLAMYYYENNQYIDSYKLISRLTDINKENARYMCYKGNILHDFGLNGLAAEAYTRAYELSQGKEAWIVTNLANLYKNVGLHSLAIDMFKKSIELDNESAFSHERLSQSIKAYKEEEVELDIRLNNVD